MPLVESKKRAAGIAHAFTNVCVLINESASHQGGICFDCVAHPVSYVLLYLRQEQRASPSCKTATWGGYILSTIYLQPTNMHSNGPYPVFLPSQVPTLNRKAHTTILVSSPGQCHSSRFKNLENIRSFNISSLGCCYRPVRNGPRLL